MALIESFTHSVNSTLVSMNPEGTHKPNLLKKKAKTTKREGEKKRRKKERKLTLNPRNKLHPQRGIRPIPRINTSVFPKRAVRFDAVAQARRGVDVWEFAAHCAADCVDLSIFFINIIIITMVLKALVMILIVILLITVQKTTARVRAMINSNPLPRILFETFRPGNDDIRAKSTHGEPVH